MNYSNMQQNQSITNNLPEKSNLWIASNIAAGALLINMIIKFLGGILFGKFITESFAIGLVYALSVVLIGAWLGSKFGVRYVTKRSVVNPEKISKISKITAVVPFIFLLIILITGAYTASAGMDTTGLTFINLFATIIFAIAVFYFCKKFLLEFVEKLPQINQTIDNTKNISSKSSNSAKILIGLIILVIISISAFFVWKSYKKDIALINPISTPSVAVIEDFSTPETTFKTFLKAYEVKNKEALLNTIDKKSLEKIDRTKRFSASLDVANWSNDLLLNYQNADYKVSEQTDKFAIMIPQNREIPNGFTKQDPLLTRQTPRMGDIFFVNKDGSWKIDIGPTFNDVATRGLFLNGYKTYSDGSTDIKAEENALERQKDNWRKSFSDTAEGRDIKRKDDLDIIDYALIGYFKDHKQYPIAESVVKLNDKNSSVYKSLVPKYSKDELPTDPKDPDFYYGYKSLDGKKFEITVRLENLDDVECKNQKEICVFKHKFAF